MSLVKGFESPTEDELKKLWSEGIFVLDTSILLNLHRYRERVRENIIDALKSIEDRLWIPFHVALEYERNRAKVIAAQRTNIRKARQKIEAIPDTIRASLNDTEVFRRHALINVDDLFNDLATLRDKFCGEVDTIQSQAADVHQEDQVRSRLERLLAGRIGTPPPDQKAVSAWNELGSLRYAREQPPGYLDQPKETSKGISTFNFGGITYDLKFGDLYIWQQLKEHALTLNGKPICFVTDDQKEDWWWLIDSNGPKRLGPRPELKEEIHRECGISLFHMYGPDAFLESMNRFRNAGIDPASVSEAREVSLEQIRQSFSQSAMHVKAQADVYNWLRERHLQDGSTFAKARFPDLLRLNSDAVVEAGYEVVYLPTLSASLITSRLATLADAANEFYEQFAGAQLDVMFIFSGQIIAQKALSQIKTYDLEFLPDGLRICTGYLDGDVYHHVGCHIRGGKSE